MKNLELNTPTTKYLKGLMRIKITDKSIKVRLILIVLRRPPSSIMNIKSITENTSAR